MAPVNPVDLAGQYHILDHGVLVARAVIRNRESLSPPVFVVGNAMMFSMSIFSSIFFSSFFWFVIIKDGERFVSGAVQSVVKWLQLSLMFLATCRKSA